MDACRIAAVNAGKNFDQGAFAGAVFAHERVDFAATHGEIDPLQGHVDTAGKLLERPRTSSKRRGGVALFHAGNARTVNTCDWQCRRLPATVRKRPPGQRFASAGVFWP